MSPYRSVKAITFGIILNDLNNHFHRLPFCNRSFTFLCFHQFNNKSGQQDKLFELNEPK